MAITLAEAKVGMADKVDQMIVDEFRRSSLLLDRLVFDNAISPGTGGSTLTYGYIQLKTPSTAAVRTINSEYTAGEAKRQEKTAKAIIMGGSFGAAEYLRRCGRTSIPGTAEDRGHQQLFPQPGYQRHCGQLRHRIRHRICAQHLVAIPVDICSAEM